MKRRVPQPLTPEQQAEKKLERDRADWRKASTQGVTLEQAMERVSGIIKEANIRGARVNWDFGGVSVRVERGWALNADLDVQTRRSYYGDYDTKTNPDNPKQHAGVYNVHCEVGWSSTNRSLASALAAITLYRELTELGAEIESVLKERPIRWVDGPES